MEVNVTMYGRRQRYLAHAVYTDSDFIVKKGSTISATVSPNMNGGLTAMKYRNDPSYVDSTTWTLLKDCRFGKPSTAAGFVSGSNTNGWFSWKLSDNKKISLGEHVRGKDNG